MVQEVEKAMARCWKSINCQVDDDYVADDRQKTCNDRISCLIKGVKGRHEDLVGGIGKEADGIEGECPGSRESIRSG